MSSPCLVPLWNTSAFIYILIAILASILVESTKTTVNFQETLCSAIKSGHQRILAVSPMGGRFIILTSGFTGLSVPAAKFRLKAKSDATPTSMELDLSSDVKELQLNSAMPKGDFSRPAWAFLFDGKKSRKSARWKGVHLVVANTKGDAAAVAPVSSGRARKYKVFVPFKKSAHVSLFSLVESTQKLNPPNFATVLSGPKLQLASFGLEHESGLTKNNSGSFVPLKGSFSDDVDVGFVEWSKYAVGFNQKTMQVIYYPMGRKGKKPKHGSMEVSYANFFTCNQPDENNSNGAFVCISVLLLLGVGLLYYYKFVRNAESSKSGKSSIKGKRKGRLKSKSRSIKSSRFGSKLSVKNSWMAKSGRSFGPKWTKTKSTLGSLRRNLPPSIKITSRTGSLIQDFYKKQNKPTGWRDESSNHFSDEDSLGPGDFF